MKEVENKVELSKFFRVTSPLDIDINKEEIFYRDKYNEIINYIKTIITKPKGLEIYNYVKPKGVLLININPGTDIIDFFKVIASNYYLELYEFNKSEIHKSPNSFFKNFNYNSI